MKTPRPNDRITDGIACPQCIHPADYIRAVKIKRIRRYSLAERVLIFIIASLSLAFAINIFRA